MEQFTLFPPNMKDKKENLWQASLNYINSTTGVLSSLFAYILIKDDSFTWDKQ